MKKKRHKKIEQKRRDGIKNKFSELRAVVPHSNTDTQATLLDKTVDLINKMRQQHEELFARALMLQEDYQKLGGQKVYFLSSVKATPLEWGIAEMSSSSIIVEDSDQVPMPGDQETALLETAQPPLPLESHNQDPSSTGSAF